MGQILLPGVCRIIKDGPSPVVLHRRTAFSRLRRGVEKVGLPVSVDFVERWEGPFLFLSRAGNAAVAESDLIRPVQGPAHARGMSLWDAVWSILPEDAQSRILAGPTSIPPTVVEEWIKGLFKHVERGRWIVAGKTLPLQVGTRYVEFPPHEAAGWHFGIITDQAMQRSPETLPSFVQIRVFVQEEWRALSTALPPIGEALPELTAAPKGRTKSEGHAEFLREAFTYANREGFSSRAEMKKYMLGWAHQQWEKPPSDRTMERWLEDLYPADLPHR